MEEILNQARAERGLPLRMRYFGDAVPLGDALLSVRLRFRSGDRTLSAALLADRKRVEAASANRAALGARARGASRP